MFGIPDETYGEQVCAWLKATRPLGLEEVRDYCRGRIAHFKVPAAVRCVEAFPMTVTGKIRKVEMREMMAAQSASSMSPANITYQ